MPGFWLLWFGEDVCIAIQFSTCSLCRNFYFFMFCTFNLVFMVVMIVCIFFYLFLCVLLGWKGFHYFAMMACNVFKMYL